MGWKRRPLNVITHTVRRRLTCGTCGARFSRQMTFQGTAELGRDRPTVRAALVAEGQAWEPPLLCTPCADGAH